MPSAFARPLPVAAVALLLLTIQGLIVWRLGHPLICACGTVALWQGVVLSAENSQHLTDWYTFSHLMHGAAFYALLAWAAPGWSLGARLLLALGLEGSWEVLENTPFLMERYRQGALAEGYFGDSVINSLCDSAAMALGFGATARLPVAATLGAILALELFTGFMIRDNLTLNIVQLIHPTEAISHWQRGD